ncbi:hypothetical protein FIBSPDRAFT_875247 [Athelia psychrophila]|uniref:BTB domain-containing protein n=1 Tax=Athelia psychrophila TaxID=1759441 RepID=A0A165WJ35_9AGAM|nr:hypothetical protein FIBSPDRAFT_875247 [Fibularhizoctonia sp. CBS 109695]
MRGTVPLRDDEQSKSVEASHAPTDTYPMHERFCFPAENIYLLVNGVIYSVHRYFFERDSSSFAGQGLSRREPMVLAGINTRDHDLFLSILYPSRYGVNEWLPGAYGTVCVRPTALTLDEGRRLGIDDVIRINAIRQEFYVVPVPVSLALFHEVQEQVDSRFGLAVQTIPLLPVEPLSDAEELGPNGKPLSSVMLQKRQKEREARQKAGQEAKEKDEDEEADEAKRAAEEASATEEQRMDSTREPESAPGGWGGIEAPSPGQRDLASVLGLGSNSFEPVAAPEPPAPEPVAPAVEAPPADDLGPNGKPLSKVMLMKRRRREARKREKAAEAQRAAEGGRAAADLP